MDVLPDILCSGLPVVICGTAVGECSAARGHYYAGPGNGFWRLLHESGLTPRRLLPEDDDMLPEHGIGLTDLVKDVCQSSDRKLTFDVPSLSSKLSEIGPRWIGFNGKVAAEAVARSLGAARPGLGLQSWQFANSRVFVLPSSSGANQRKEYDGRTTRLEWWTEFANLIDGSR